MKRIFLFAVLLCNMIGFAQIPNGYYNNATGTGYTLKTQLYNIIKGHTTKTYNALYTCYLTSDRDYFYENDGTVLDIYSEKPGGVDSYTYSATNTGDRCGNYSSEGDCYNREHIMPQSVFNEQSPMVSDPHHILPTDGKVNGMRNNYAFGKVSNPTWTSTNGSKLGPNTAPGYNGTVFEPIDEFKGDVARCLLYFATRYENTIGNYNHAMLNGTTNQAFSNWFLALLLTWHNQDPVSAREIARNNAIYTFQGNRNPYIDHPEYACMIWNTANCALANVGFDALSNVSVYPNPTNNRQINIVTEKTLDGIQLLNLNGQIVREVKQPEMQNNSYLLENLPQGFYLLKLTSENQSVTKKILVN